MKKLALVILLAWFFGFRLPSSEPGVFISMIQGPYKTQEACEKDYYRNLDAMKLVLDPDEFKAIPCKEPI